MTGFEFRVGPAAGMVEVLANGHLMGTVSFDDELRAWLAEADQQSSWFPNFGCAVNFLYAVYEPEPARAALRRSAPAGADGEAVLLLLSLE
jgi:hypothetical protein